MLTIRFSKVDITVELIKNGFMEFHIGKILIAVQQKGQSVIGESKFSQLLEDLEYIQNQQKAFKNFTSK